METFQNHIMRFMTNHRIIDHVKIEDLLKTTSLTPIISTIKSKVFKLFGHIKRSEVGLSKIYLEGAVEGKRNTGRPKKRLRDNILTWSQLDLADLNVTSRDRARWKTLSHVSAQSAVGGDSGP